jgi:prepilin-type N-terminal cleavage/methylation domain-containing protein
MKISKDNASKRSAFTLVELVVVVVVIGLLAAIATPTYLASIKKAQDSKATAVVSAIEKAKDAYILARVPAGVAIPATDPFNAADADGKLALLAPYLSQSLGTQNLTKENIVKGTGRTTVNFGTVQQNTAISNHTNGSVRQVATLTL